jgi:alpha-tubulin suppressor-like RCC1 family protein
MKLVRCYSWCEQRCASRCWWVFWFNSLSCPHKIRYYLWLWDNSAGQLGLGDGGGSNRNTPSLMIFTIVYYKAISIAAGGTFSYLISTQGNAYGFGAAIFTGCDPYRPVPVESYTGNIISVQSGTSTTAAISRSGQVESVGQNIGLYPSTLGTGDTIDRSSPVTLLLSNVTQISLKWSSTLAVTSDGFVYAWGGKPNGELGVKTANIPILTPKLV